MPVKAQVPNLGTIIIENAAEESTMRQILAAINKQGGFTAGGGKNNSGGGGGGAPVDTGADMAEINRKRMEEGAQGEKRFAAVLKGTSETIQSTANTFASGFSNVTPDLKTFSNVLANYSPEPFATTMQVMGGTLNDQIEIFRQLSQSGIDLGDSLLSAQLKAGEARLPLEIFGKTVKENSFILASAFGGASAGADRFAEVQGKFMARSGQNFAKLGFSMDELATYNASYMEQMQRSGRLESMSTDQIVAGQQKYNEELDKLSKATGISRKQLDEANQAAQRDTRMRLALQGLGAEERAAVTAKMEELKKLDPTGKMAAGFADLIAGGGVALTKEARMFTLAMQQSGVDASKMTRDIYSGQAGAVAQMNRGFTQAAKDAQTMSEGTRRTTTALATMGVETPMYYKATLAGMGDSQKKLDAATEEQAKKLASKDPTRAAAGLDQTLTEIQNSFKKSLIETKVFEVTAVGFQNATAQVEKFADKFAGMNTSEKLASMIGLEAAKKVLGFLKDYGLETAGAVYGARKAGMAWDEYQARKEGTIKPGQPGGTKIPGAATEIGESAAEKPGMGKKIANFFKGLTKKAGLALLTVGGVTYVVNEYDLVGAGVDKLLGESGEKPATPLSLEEQRRRDRIPGAELPKASEPKTTEPAATPEAKVNVNSESVAKLNTEVNALKTALKDFDYSKLMFPEAIGTSIDAGIIKLKNLREEITTTTGSFKDFSNVNLENLSSNISKLGEAIKQTTEGNKETAGVAAAPAFDASKQVVELLNQLNSNMSNLANMQGDAVDYLSKTAKYTRQASNNIV